MASRTGSRPPAPPPSATLEQLPADDWAIVLRAARGALNDLREDVLTPRMQQLRAAPTSRLVSGRSRVDLCRLLNAEPLLWRETFQRLESDPEARGFDWLFGDEPPPTASEEQPADEPEPAEERLREEIDRLRQRGREFLEQRDDARRRAQGLEARLGIERDKREEAEREIARLRRERDELEERLEAADEERRETIARARRRHDAELADLRDELRSYRRREQERRQRRARREQKQRSVESRAREEIASYRAARDSHGRSVTPGRPSRLPPGVAPDSREAADLLLHEGRDVLVDGYNVTKTHRSAAPLAQQRVWLVGLLEPVTARRGLRTRIVFDGDPTARPPPLPTRHVQVEFATGQSADDRLVEIVSGLPADEPVLCVTDDRELRERLAGHDVDLVRTGSFLAVVA